MVDSTPTATGPPSTIRSMRPSRSALHMRGRCRRDMAGEIGRRRHHGTTERAQDRACDRVRGNADRDGLEAGGREFRHRAIGRPRQHQGQRSRPEGVGEREGGFVETADGAGRSEIADMGDQRVESGPSLGLIEAGDRKGIGGVGPEPINRLGRERDQPALGERPRGRPPWRPRRPAKSLWSGRFARGPIPWLGFLRCGEGDAISRGLSRSVAQPGRALRSGRRGRRFESCHSDHFASQICSDCWWRSSQPCRRHAEEPRNSLQRRGDSRTPCGMVASFAFRP